MLRKRNRSVQKDQQVGHSMASDAMYESYFHAAVLGHKHRSNSFLSLPGLFVGLSPKGSSDFDAAKSPTSPLDFRFFSNLGNPFRSPRTYNKKSWDCNKVGLRIIDSLDDDRMGKVLRSSESKTILFGSQTRIKTPSNQGHLNFSGTSNSLPKNYANFPRTQLNSSGLQKGNSDVLFEIGESPLEAEAFGKIRSCSLDSGKSLLLLTNLAGRNPDLSSGNFGLKNMNSNVSSPRQFTDGSINLDNCSLSKPSSVPMPVNSNDGLIGSLSASDIELSEDYTRVISHGPNPKTTHIFGDCILECHTNELANFGKKEEAEVGFSGSVQCSGISAPFPSNDFLSFCYSCKKKLEGKDIYMYRGEKAFCSLVCRSQEILIEEEMEKTNDDSTKNSLEANSSEELFETSSLSLREDAPIVYPYPLCP